MRRRSEDPSVGSRLWSSGDSCFAIQQADVRAGKMMYRHKLISSLPAIGLVLTINKRYVTLEKTGSGISAGHNPASGSAKVFNRIFVRYGIRDDVTGQRLLVEAAKRHWKDGHVLLDMLGSRYQWHNTAWSKETTKEVFGDGYFAVALGTNPAETLRYAKLERKWRDKGRQPLPAYFAGFGVLNAARQYDEDQERAIRELSQAPARKLNPGEARCVNTLRQILSAIDADILNYIDSIRTIYQVVETDCLLGAHQQKSGGFRRVRLSTKFFPSDFATAFSVFLHEHAHGLGCDGSREFTDALTELIATVIEHREKFELFEQEWGRTQAQLVDR